MSAPSRGAVRQNCAWISSHHVRSLWTTNPRQLDATSTPSTSQVSKSLAPQPSAMHFSPPPARLRCLPGDRGRPHRGHGAPFAESGALTMGRSSSVTSWSLPPPPALSRAWGFLAFLTWMGQAQTWQSACDPSRYTVTNFVWLHSSSSHHWPAAWPLVQRFALSTRRRLRFAISFAFQNGM